MILRNIVIVSFVLLLTSLHLKAQDPYILKILDKTTKHPVTGAYLLMNNLSVGFTDENGIFRITETSSDTIYLTHIIYKPQQILISNLNSDTNYIFLEEQVYQLSDANVFAQKANVIAKQASKHFRMHYRTWSYWSECQYRQAIRLNKEYKSYMECKGYAYLPVFEGNIWRSAPILVPQQIRRTREDPALQPLGYADKQRFALIIAPTFMGEFCDFIFLDVIHPLNRWNYRNYIFSQDTVNSSQEQETVLVFRQKKNGFFESGRWIHECHGKLWIDKENGHIKKMDCTFYRNSHFNNIRILYKEMNGNIFLETVNMDYIYQFYGKNRKKEQLFVESEIKFPKINQERRDNYMKHNGIAIDYRFQALVPDYAYIPEEWKKDKPDNKWTQIINQISNNQAEEEEEEFVKGSREKIWDKTCKYYRHIQQLAEEARKMLEQMKTDLHLVN